MSIRISDQEWHEITQALEVHHAIFYKIWQIGIPFLCTEFRGQNINTAAVFFHKNGEFAYFCFNPKFWSKITFTKKLWVICHEMQHIILRHGVRSIDASYANSKALNVAQDIVINHGLETTFGFVRDDIDDWRDYCYIETVFAEKKEVVLQDQCFEYYYNLFDKIYGNSVILGSDGMPNTVDDHSFFANQNEENEKFNQKLNDLLTPEEKKNLQNYIDKHFQKKDNSIAGQGKGDWTFINIKTPPKKRKWETIIRDWMIKSSDVEFEIEQVAIRNRRFVAAASDLMIPSSLEVDDAHGLYKINVWFYLDTSGSCWHLKDRFFTAAMTLPPDRFNVRLFCFDTEVYETDLKSKNVYGGGGTSFDILEDEVIVQMQKGKIKKYPDAVFVITDGYGNSIKPKHPDRWHWFMTEDSIKSYIDKNCKFYMLKDYE